MSTYRNTSRTTAEIGGGKLLAPGAAAEVDTDNPRVRRAIDAGRLVQVGAEHVDAEAEAARPTKAQLEARAKTLQIKGRSTMSAEELQNAIRDAESATATEEESDHDAARD